METLKRKRNSLVSSMLHLEEFYDQVDHENIDYDELEVRFEDLEEIKKEFKIVYDTIMSKSKPDELEGHENENASFKNRYILLKAKFMKMKKGNQALASTAIPASSAVSHSTSTDIRLPRLDLPTYNGNIHEWLSFHDLFITTIHNNEKLSGAQKLQYLKASLKGEASSLLNAFQVTDQNYLEAWNLLIQRYQNKKEIVQSHLKRLFNQATLQTESSSGLRKLVDTTTESLRSLKVLQQPIEYWDTIIVYLVTNKIDTETRKNWELSQKSDELATWKDLMEFLDQRSRALAAINTNKPKPTQDFKHSHLKSTLACHGTTSYKCIVCSEAHVIFHCPKFLKMSIEDRKEVVKKNSLCFNCLHKGHSISDCKGGNCKHCNNKHNSLLHINKPSGSEDTGSHFSSDKNNTQVLLSTVNVLIRDVFGKTHLFRALLDNGSQTSFITEKCIQQLQLKKRKTDLNVTGIGSISLGKANKIVNFSLSSDKNDFSMEMTACIVRQITGELPNHQVEYNNWTHLQGLTLADPQFYLPRHVDLLLGADVYADIILNGKVCGDAGTPTAFNSIFGWTVVGKYTKLNKNITTTNNLHVQCDVDTTIQKFWELEELPSKRLLTPDEKICEDHFAQTHSRDDTGRYIVRLPFKANTKDLGESRTQAISRLRQVERRYAKQPERRQEYNNVLQEYIEIGHMELVPENEIHRNENSVYYLPHHAVIKEDSTTTRLRVVFDASAKTRTGISLNDKLHIGPRLQDDLISILLRFRKHPIAFTADIEKMYRQFAVHKDDVDFQRIVWRKDEAEPIKDYRLLTATFGTTSAPYAAIKCVQQLAEDEKHEFPAAATILKEDLYVDDLLSGAESEQYALELQQQLLKIMDLGKLKLRKWSSNNAAVLEALPLDMRESKQPLNLDKDNTVKTLGLFWNPSSDSISFHVVLPPARAQDTKRSLLSDMGKVFDPLGFLSPVTINVKLMFQNLWRENIGWDDKLPSQFQKQWNEYREELKHIQDLNIPRYILISNYKIIELHGFSDSSEMAYSAVVYSRSMSHDGSIQVQLIAAKTKVAPLKKINLPRLELCGALLLSRLIQLIINSLKMNINNVYCYSDSTIVLAWIASLPHRWNTFVANRVTEIQEIVSSSQWYYVRSEDNPADCATRGVKSSELLSHPLWWHGPEFLHKKELILSPSPEISSIPEERKSVLVTHVNINTSLLTRFSSLSTLIRTTAYWKRYFHNKKTADLNQRKLGSLSVDELDTALLHWIKVVQTHTFAEEIQTIKDKQNVSKTSKIINLAPFLDNNGILRVGGRLKNSSCSSSQKNPILLPKRNSLTDLLLDFYHKSHLHCGPQLLLATLQRKYWILGAKDLINHFVRKCVICVRHRATVTQQMMGSLPAARVNPTRPFLRCGVDYGGPFLIRVMKGRNTKTFKSYICLFICFVTRAIHLELVSDLTTDAFIASLKRFVSRRGLPTDIYSDSGTNFVGANKELKEFLRLTQSQSHNDTISKYLAEKRIQWHFSPPTGAHFGGLWEAGIKSVKYHLTRIIGNATLTFEELSTILTQVEACLNSRPLTAMSADPSDYSPLTPGHFLIGDALTAVPEPDYTDLKQNHLSRWQYTQRLLQNFWNRWSSEFLSRLQQRPKWNLPKENLVKNQLVLIKDERLPPLQWKLARILDVHPGKDDLVRVATVKTAEGVYKRPVAKLCILPIEATN